MRYILLPLKAIAPGAQKLPISVKLQGPDDGFIVILSDDNLKLSYSINYCCCLSNAPRAQLPSEERLPIVGNAPHWVKVRFHVHYVVVVILKPETAEFIGVCAVASPRW